jgi:hypothetical protein
LEDGLAPNWKEPPGRKGVQVNNLWSLDHRNISLDFDEPDPCPEGKPMPLHPPSGGNVFRIVEFSPEASWIDDVGRSKDNWLPLTSVDGGARHPFMHRSETIDYAICLSGQIWCLLDDSEVLMKAGDVMIQRGTNHAWKNSFEEPCRMVFVLMDGKFTGDLKEKLPE